MVPVDAPFLELHECNSEQEREFIEAMHDRAVAGKYRLDSWPHSDRIILSICRFHPIRKHVTSTLRVDFNGTALAFGFDETHQFATDLYLAPQATIIEGRPIIELATIAADWLEEMVPELLKQKR